MIPIEIASALFKKRVRFLDNVTNALSDSLDLQTLVTQVARLATPMIADFCVVDVPLEHSASVVGCAHRDPEQQRHLLDFRQKYPPDEQASFLSSRAMKTGRAAIYPIVTDAILQQAAADEESLLHMRRLEPTSLFIAPLRARGKTIGVISFAYAGSERAFSEDDLEICETFSQRAALAIENAILFKQATDAATIRENFLSIASHELKGPLTAIHSQTQLMRRMLTERRTDQLEKLVDNAGRDVARLARLIDNLFDNTCIAAGQLVLKKERTDLVALSRNVLERLKSEIASSGSRVEFTSDPAVVGSWDRLRLEQVLINLLTNALKYGSAKPVSVKLRVQNGFASLAIQDQGIGIPKKNLGRIFDRFERATTRQRIGSLGLGLFIARQIVQAHQGTLSVISGLGEGSRFTVEIPVQHG